MMATVFAMIAWSSLQVLHPIDLGGKGKISKVYKAYTASKI